jgi:hypothetical protein
LQEISRPKMVGDEKNMESQRDDEKPLDARDNMWYL